MDLGEARGKMGNVIGRGVRTFSHSGFGVETRGGLTTAHCLSTPKPVLFLLGWFQDLERTEQALVDAHHGTRIVKFTTIVGR